MKAVATKKEFDQIVKDNKLVAIDFTATWCGPCKMIRTILKKKRIQF